MKRSVQDVIAAAETLGAELRLDGTDVRVRYPEQRRSKLLPILKELRDNRSVVVDFLRARMEEARWPPECVEAAHRLNRSYARLYPLINKRVQTPLGTGILQQVLGDKTIRVALDGNPERMTTFTLEDVLPMMI